MNKEKFINVFDKLKNNIYFYAIVTCLFSITVFLIAYFSYSCHDFVCFGPLFDALAYEIISIPLFLIFCSIIILFVFRSFKKILIYLGYSFFLVFSFNLIFLGIEYFFEEDKEFVNPYLVQKEINERNSKYVEDMIGETILKSYKNVKFSMDGDINNGSCGLTFIDVYGFEYKNEPNIDEEILKWKDISNDLDYPCHIRVRYHFNDNDNAYLSFFLDEYNFYYSSLGLEELELELIASNVNTFLNNKDFKYEVEVIVGSKDIYVNVPKKLSEDEKIFEEEFWNEFIESNNFKFDCLNIKYYDPSSISSYITYSPLLGSKWFGDYD